jgi:hypothetical protein
MKKSARKKKLVASEEELIKAIIKQPYSRVFCFIKRILVSYETMNELDTLTPKKGISF